MTDKSHDPNQMTGAAMIVRALIDHGVQHVFGHPGGAVLVDTGCGGPDEVLNYWRVVNRSVADALAGLDMTPADIDLVINTHLHLDHTHVDDAGLAQFKGMSMMSLWIDETDITDLTPLQGMPLEEIHLTPKNITKGLDILRGMKSLKTIGIAWKQFWPAAEFWERYDKGEFK